MQPLGVKKRPTISCSLVAMLLELRFRTFAYWLYWSAVSLSLSLSLSLALYLSHTHSCYIYSLLLKPRGHCPLMLIVMGHH